MCNHPYFFVRSIYAFPQKTVRIFFVKFILIGATLPRSPICPAWTHFHIIFKYLYYTYFSQLSQPNEGMFSNFFPLFFSRRLFSFLLLLLLLSKRGEEACQHCRTLVLQNAANNFRFMIEQICLGKLVG